LPPWEAFRERALNILAAKREIDKDWDSKRNFAKESFRRRETVREILSATKSEKLYGEYVFNRVVIEAWRKSAIGSLAISKTEFVDLIKQSGWHYDE